MSERAIKTALALVALVATAAAAHTPLPEDVLASLGAPSMRVGAGIERADRDPRNPRLLVVRVGPSWFALPADARAAAAAEWYDDWRRVVPQGVVAVLDAGTDRVVVRFGRGGTVVEVRDRPG
jgi:hypothetical protein